MKNIELIPGELYYVPYGNKNTKGKSSITSFCIATFVRIDPDKDGNIRYYFEDKLGLDTKTPINNDHYWVYGYDNINKVNQNPISNELKLLYYSYFPHRKKINNIVKVSNVSTAQLNSIVEILQNYPKLEEKCNFLEKSNKELVEKYDSLLRVYSELRNNIYKCYEESSFDDVIINL